MNVIRMEKNELIKIYFNGITKKMITHNHINTSNKKNTINYELITIYSIPVTFKPLFAPKLSLLYFTFLIRV